MTAHSIIEQLHETGVTFRVVDGRLQFRCATALSQADRDRIHVHRDELLALLAGDPPLDCSIPNTPIARASWLWARARAAGITADQFFELIDERFNPGPLGPYALDVEQTRAIADALVVNGHAESQK